MILRLRRARRTIATIGAVLCLLFTPGFAPRSSAKELVAAAPIVRAGGETLRGVKTENGVRAFLGIPYAAPPIGDWRWKAPRPHEPRLGVQSAERFGAACPQDQGNPNWYRQIARAMGASGDAVPDLEAISEDCLFLNVWTPTRSERPNGKGYPVLVWIHGGSNVNGFAHEPNYHGDRLAAAGVVVVSINYRLGLLGFFAHPALGEDASGHQGLLDQIAALRWVRANIARFGGDPGRVTVFGESAGGTDIAALMHMNEAKLLFQRAIVQSGYLAPDGFSTEAEAKNLAVELFGAEISSARLRAIPWRDLVDMRAKRLAGRFFAPVVEGARVFAVPAIVGTNRDEGRMYLPQDVAGAYADALEALGPRRDAVRAFLEASGGDLEFRADQLESGPSFACGARRFAREILAAGQSAFLYRFDRVRPGPHGLGAYHGAEIPYVFGTPDDWLPEEVKDRDVSAVMMRAFLNFAHTGDPNGAGVPNWPRADEGTGIVFDAPPRALETTAFTLCDLLGD